MKIAILLCLLPAVLGKKSTYSSHDNIIKQSYESFDTDGNGRVELSDVRYFFTREDTDGNGLITFQEYSAAESPWRSNQTLSMLFKYYDTMDGTSDGLISDLIGLVVFKRMDTNNDDRVSFKEFFTHVNLMNRDVANDVINTMARE